MLDFLIIAGGVFGMASGSVANKFIFRYMDQALFTSLRFFISGILLAIGVYFHSPRNLFKRYAHFLAPITLITFLTNFLPAQLKAYALAVSFSSKIAVIGALDPFVTALYSRILYGQKLSWRQMAGMVVAFSAVAVLVISHDSGNHEAQAFGRISWGELAALGWLLINRLGWMQAQKLMKHHHLSAQELNACAMTLGGVFGLLWVFICKPSFSLHASNCIQAGSHPELLVAIFYTIVIGNMIGYTLYAKALALYSSNFTQMAYLSLPPVMYLLGHLVLGEPLYPAFWLAMALLAVGMYIFYSQPKVQSMPLTESTGD